MGNRSTSRGITTPKGFRAAGVTCGIKESGKPDLTMIVADRPCTAAGIFTTNNVQAAPVSISRRHLRFGKAQAIVCNSGNANAATGPSGYQDTVATCQLVAQEAGLADTNSRWVLPSSTGVIGRRLPMEKIRAGIAAAAAQLARGRTADAAAARAIMTTDRVPKQAYRSTRLGPKPGRLVHIAGVCKGSGMIAPHMATMLAFITTDANLPAPMLSAALREAVAVTFNRMSIDQHTSPNDAVLAMASGAAANPTFKKGSPDAKRFGNALTQLCADLAYQIVQDGEGATRVFRVIVLGARSQIDADRVGKAIVDSPLVKAAVHGGDPNWGRIITAAGYSKATVKPERLSLHIGQPRHTGSGGRGQKEICVFRGGQPVNVRGAALNRLTRIMTGDEVVFTVDLGLGQAGTQWLGCDLSREYVAINADYTT